MLAEVQSKRCRSYDDELDKELPLEPTVLVPPSPLHINLPPKDTPIVPIVPCKRTNDSGVPPLRLNP